MDREATPEEGEVEEVKDRTNDMYAEAGRTRLETLPRLSRLIWTQILATEAKQKTDRLEGKASALQIPSLVPPRNAPDPLLTFAHPGVQGPRPRTNDSNWRLATPTPAME
jgi:hypothetical protein